ncbi:hypothetical protein PtB15_1B641 [Puccinia triticina]|nr:hypothetical protein PtB15_1B641 [Puccinia triticina]
MISIQQTLLGIALFHHNLISAAHDGIFQTNNHNIDSEVFGNLEDMTDFNFARHRISETDTFHNMDLVLTNRLPRESSHSYFPDVYNYRNSAGSVPTSSLSTGVVSEKGIQNTNNVYQTSNPFLKERELYEGLGVDQHAVYQSLPKTVSTSKPRSSESHLEWKSRAKSMKGPRKMNKIGLTAQQDNSQSAIHGPLNQTGNRKTKKYVRVKAEVIFKELEDAKKDTILGKQLVAAREKEYKMATDERKAFKDFRNKVENKREELQLAYGVRNTRQYRVALELFLQQTDPELEGKKIAIYPPPFRHTLSRNGMEANHNSYIKLILPSAARKQSEVCANRLVHRITMIGHYLDYMQQFPHFITEVQEQGIIPDEEHQDLLEWFYNLVFKDTQDHPPLLGWAEIHFSPQQNANKKFNPTQILIYKSLMQSGTLTIPQAGRVALELRKIWLRSHSLISKEQRQQTAVAQLESFSLGGRSFAY